MVRSRGMDIALSGRGSLNAVESLRGDGSLACVGSRFAWFALLAWISTLMVRSDFMDLSWALVRSSTVNLSRTRVRSDFMDLSRFLVRSSTVNLS